MGFSFFVAITRLLPGPGRRAGLLLVLVLAMLAQPAMVQGNRQVTVGVFQVEPIIFIDAGGRPQGLFVDVIEQIADKEGWHLKYVPGTWNEGFQRMRSGAIDLMTAVAYSAERDEYLDYCQEPVVTLWGQVFVKEGVSLENILELDGKTVAIMEGDINGKNFLETAAKFELSCQIREYPSLGAVFQAVARDEVAAGVAPNIFGYRHAREYGLVGTGVIFSPVSAFFATAGGSNAELLTRIDQYLGRWKDDKESFYYRRLDHWFGGEQFERPPPFWLFVALCAIVLVAVVLGLWSRNLWARVAEKSKELRRSEENYKQLVENSNSIILRWDVHGQVTFLNEYGQRFFGYRFDEIVGRHLVGTIVAQSDRSGRDLKAMIQDILTRPEQYLFNENENMCKDGTRVWVQWSNKPIYDEQGRLREILGVGFDITKLNRVEREKLENEQRYRLLFDSASDAIMVIKNNVYWDCNKKTLEMFGCTMADIVHATPASFSPPRQPDGRPSPEAAQGYIDAALAGENQFFTWQHQRLDGTVFDAEVSFNRIVLDHQDYIQAIVRDVSERSRLESDLRQAQKMEAIGTLAGGIAHDFNNILTSIFGYTELAMMHLADEKKVHDDLGQVRHAAERARTLVQQILTFSRKTDQQKRPLQVALVAKEAIKLLRASIPTTIDIRQQITMGEQSVLADPTQIHQIFLNLGTNAFHAMRQDGGVLSFLVREVRLGTEEAALTANLQPGNYLEIEVSDTGIGMDAQIRDKIFEPYFTTKKAGEGTGLGLAVVHGIVRDLQGAIHVYSEPGQGTTFRIYLPIVEPVAQTGGQETVSSNDKGGHEHILFVDDERQILQVAHDVFTAYSYQITTCDDPLEALTLVTASPETYHLLVTDMTMPGMNGLELADKVRAVQPDLPVVLCTGHSELINKEKARARGIREYVSKPMAMSKLVAIVKRVLSESRT